MKRERDLQSKKRKSSLRGKVELPHRASMVIEHHVVRPTSISLVKSYLKKAQEKGLVQDPRDYTIGAAALLSAGMSKADEAGVRYVTPHHINKGWTETLRFGGGNCPPHRCMRRSVLQRVDELKESVPYFGDLLNVMEK